ncbi:MAG: ROK family protein [Bryobacter sp.]|nr:ROK family protein [Bryobacter sp.]
MIGAVEAGGTKFICAYGTSPGDLTVSAPIPTRSPKETMRDVAAFFQGVALERVGVAAFGPLDLERGAMTKKTPKIPWRGFPMRAALEDALGVPAAVDTDVNGAALGEFRWGAGQGCDHFIYLTVGTGIGGGGLYQGRLMRGLPHPEMGHIRVPRAKGDRFRGCCPSHGDCLEGMASGKAIEVRGGDARFESEYLAQALNTYICTVSPKRIILGGGVMKTPGLLAAVKKRTRELVNGYAPLPEIVKAALGDRAGVLGALALALPE